MRHRTTITAALLAATLTACSSNADDSAEKPPAASSSPAVDCGDTNLSQAEWMKHCEEAAPEDTAAAEPLTLGKTAQTIGSEGTGELDLTPDTVVYTSEGTGQTPAGDTFATVAFKAKNVGAIPAAQAAPIEGGGWTWTTADGQAVSELDGEASNVTPDGYADGGDIQPGTWVWDSAVFDLTTEQAKSGGTLTYLDGNGTAHQWTVPATDTGPQVDKLTRALTE